MEFAHFECFTLPRNCRILLAGATLNALRAIRLARWLRWRRLLEFQLLTMMTFHSSIFDALAIYSRNKSATHRNENVSISYLPRTFTNFLSRFFPTVCYRIVFLFSVIFIRSSVIPWYFIYYHFFPFASMLLGLLPERTHFLYLVIWRTFRFPFSIYFRHDNFLRRLCGYSGWQPVARHSSPFGTRRLNVFPSKLDSANGDEAGFSLLNYFGAPKKGRQHIVAKSSSIIAGACIRFTFCAFIHNRVQLELGQPVSIWMRTICWHLF